MTGPLIALFVIYAVVVAVVALALHRAPLGWEDSAGFHTGTPNTSTQPDHHSSDMLGEQGRGVSHHAQGNSDVRP